MPLRNITATGLSFHFRNTNSIVKNINKAVRLSDKKSDSGLLVPYSANNIIVNAAEMIRPNEADFNPLSTSDT